MALTKPKAEQIEFTPSGGLTASSVQDALVQTTTYLPGGTGAVVTTIQSKLRQTVSVLDFGVVGNGVADDTLKAQQALNSGALYVVIPAGVTVATTGLSLAAGQVLQVVGAIKKLSGTNPIVTLNHNSKLIGPGEINGNSVVCDGVASVSKNNIDVSDLYIHHVGGKGVVSYTSGQLVRINNNRIENITSQAISVEYSNGCVITNNTINTALHGIQWWGGDSNVMTTIGVFDLKISNNHVYNVMGGIWGSLGQNISVTGNHVENCSDVGIDFEGCRNFSCAGNNAFECSNGCYSVFFGCSGGTFSGNTARNTTTNGAAFYAVGNGVYTNQYLAIIGNTFTTKTRSIDAGAFGGRSLSNSSIANNVMSTTGGFPSIHIRENTNLMVTNNHITTINTAIGIYFDGVSNSMIRDNMLFGAGDTNNSPTNGGGILLKRRSTAFPSVSNVVRGNRIDAYMYSIVDDCTGDVTQSNNDIEHNHVTNVYRSVGATYNGVTTNNINVATPSVAVTTSTF